MLATVPMSFFGYPAAGFARVFSEGCFPVLRFRASFGCQRAPLALQTCVRSAAALRRSPPHPLPPALPPSPLQLRHPNIVRCYQVIDDPASDKLYLVLEFAAGGQIVHWQPEKGSYAAGDTGLPLTETVARSYMRDIILGLEYLHQSNVAHRDMKPENLLVTADGRCKITDFGVSKMFDEGSDGFVTDTEGTHAYFSPESCSGKEYSAYMDDVWGLGVCLYAMVRMRCERACVCMCVCVCVCVCVLARGLLRSR